MTKLKFTEEKNDKYATTVLTAVSSQPQKQQCGFFIEKYLLVPEGDNLSVFIKAVSISEDQELMPIQDDDGAPTSETAWVVTDMHESTSERQFVSYPNNPAGRKLAEKFCNFVEEHHDPISMPAAPLDFLHRAIYQTEGSLVRLQDKVSFTQGKNQNWPPIEFDYEINQQKVGDEKIYSLYRKSPSAAKLKGSVTSEFKSFAAARNELIKDYLAVFFHYHEKYLEQNRAAERS